MNSDTVRVGKKESVPSTIVTTETRGGSGIKRVERMSMTIREDFHFSTPNGSSVRLKVNRHSL